jgi:hypothetical protein
MTHVICEICNGILREDEAIYLGGRKKIRASVYICGGCKYDYWLLKLVHLNVIQPSKM